MSQKILPVTTKFCIRLLSSFLFTLMFVNTVIAAYNPPRNSSRSRPEGPVSSGGTRGGCSQSTQASLTALAPISHVGKTVSKQPTFAWFVPDTKSYPMELTLYEYNTDNRPKKIKTFDLISQPGIMNYSISPDDYSFSVGKKYFWQIALRCDTNSPSKDLFAEAEIEIAQIPNNLANQISQTTSSIQKAHIYAKQGFWYDALAETLKSPQNKDFQLTLLEKLRDLEAKAASNLSENLKGDLNLNRFKISLQNHALQLTNVVKIERY